MGEPIAADLREGVLQYCHITFADPMINNLSPGQDRACETSTGDDYA